MMATPTTCLRIHFRGQVRQEIELRREQVEAEGAIKKIADVLEVIGKGAPDADADNRADRADRQAGEDKDTQDRTLRRAHGANDRDVAGLVLHQQDQPLHDQQRGDGYDNRKDKEDGVAFHLQHVEEALLRWRQSVSMDCSLMVWPIFGRMSSMSLGLETNPSMTLTSPGLLKKAWASRAA